MTKAAGFTKPNHHFEQEYMEFITEMKEINRFYRHSSAIGSIDVSYIKRPKTSITSFSPKGGGKQKAVSKTLLYTNVIVTIISGDGTHRTPRLLFTRDLKMVKEQKT